MAGSRKGETADKSVILVAVDLSPVSKAVVGTAVSVAGARSTELHLLHVLRPEPPELITTQHFATVIEQTTTRLDNLVPDLPGSIERVIIHVRAGEAEIEIAQLASDIAADLIVVGTHGYKGIDRKLGDRKSTRLNSSHWITSRMPSSA